MPLGGATTNQTVLLALLDRCRQAILKEIETNYQDSQDNMTTTAPTSTAVATTSRRTYDNAYCYILFVMFFYSFLALTLFKGFVQYDEGKKEPYEEFMTPADSSKQKCNTGPTADKIDFEEENSI
ncbi:Paired box Pax-3 [Labeo rohita]|uniref:Paired box Pax-3 n=1 Tax=Labeo rohita TaxID=84645 RepID=A0A498MU80_LABRO|nr:Paired box Pax-3 [Labeo rohita]